MVTLNFKGGAISEIGSAEGVALGYKVVKSDGRQQCWVAIGVHIRIQTQSLIKCCKVLLASLKDIAGVFTSQTQKISVA